MQVTVEFTHFWHCGSGRAGGKKVDALVEKDAQQLAFIPGKTLKGILREAVRQAESFGAYDDISTDSGILLENLLFGARDENRDRQFSGMLAVSDASLSLPEKQYLMANSEKISLLYRDINRTAIDHQTGSAIPGSLRGQEVSIPMYLVAELEILSSPSPRPEITQARELLLPCLGKLLRRALPLVDGIGGLRQRGLGRCILTLEE